MTAMFWATLAGPLVALIVGAAQCALIWYGIQAMKASNESRGQQGEALAALVEGLRDQSAGIRELLERSRSA